jgi:hypothetical protein
MKKTTIKFTGKYIGEDKPNIKKGYPIFMEFNKEALKSDYLYDSFCRDGNGEEKISLITYVKERFNRICLTEYV